MTEAEIKQLLAKLYKLSLRGKEIYIKAFMLSDLLLHSGLRIGEAQAIRHRDFYLTDQPRLHVTNGKGNKERWVPLGSSKLRLHIQEYTQWKESIMQGTQPNDYFFMSKCQACYSVSGLQGLCKIALRTIGLDHKHSAHHFRHSFAVQHYHRNLDLRGLQLLLGHENPQTTANAYCHRPFSELLAGVENLYEGR